MANLKGSASSKAQREDHWVGPVGRSKVTVPTAVVSPIAVQVPKYLVDLGVELLADPIANGRKRFDPSQGSPLRTGVVVLEPLVGIESRKPRLVDPASSSVDLSRRLSHRRRSFAR